ncbi:MAG: DUF3990 domain-containing protein [Oscillospiraceae bacterium]|nr:DUF3990 domain-containing protein [Oscillospiraceae bacterium]
MEVSNPDLGYSSRYLDFGEGFYLTTNEEQAIQFSHKVIIREAKRGNKIGTATVSSYEFDLLLAKSSLKMLDFELPSEEWFNFVIDNRRGVVQSFIYDIIYGPVANDDVYQVIGLFEDGILSKENAITALKVKQLFNQYTLKTNAALGLLKFISSKTY